MVKSDEFLKKGRIFRGSLRDGRMGPPTGGMMEGLLVSNSPFLGDVLDPPLQCNIICIILLRNNFIFPFSIHMKRYVIKCS